MKNPDEYFMAFANLSTSRANCIKREVGAVLVLDNHIIATAYNGTPTGITNCKEGGCDRCFNSKEYPTGRDYDLCICVHAEQNCILQSARQGHCTLGSIVYTTLQPCLTCMKEIVQAGVVGVVYKNKWIIPLEQKNSYDKMVSTLGFFREYTPPEEATIEIRHAISTQN